MHNNLNYVTSTIEYSYNGVLLEAYIARPDNNSSAPAVLICHAWAGRDTFVEEVAHKLAELGYVSVALDVYGKGVLGGTQEQNMALMQPLLDNRAELQGRLHAGVKQVEQLKFVMKNKMAVMGYCFGGLCALDLARMGANLTGAISIHGLFNPPDNLNNLKITAKILALHGHLDPMITHDDINQFMLELDNADADWQMVAYGKAMHAFTNPQANDPSFGTVYHSLTAKRAWQSICNFLAECFDK